MKPTIYNSGPASEIPSLAEKTWREFRPFLSVYQWAPDDPSHSYRKEQITKAITHRGRPGNCTTYRDGQKFVLKPMREWVFKKAIQKGHKIYYVSYGQVALPYLDIDIHRSWQTEADAQNAKQAIQNLFRSHVFWADSTGGKNGYLKVDLTGYSNEQANNVFTWLENSIRLVLAKLKNMADFEVKAKVGFLKNGEYHWQPYGKLPIHRDWSLKRLEEFKNTPFISIRQLETLCEEIEAEIPQGWGPVMNLVSGTRIGYNP